MKVTGALAAVACAVGLGFGGASAASAHSDTGTARFDNGQKITANAWIQNFSWTSCGSWQSSAVMKAKPKYITNRTSF